TLLTYLTSPAIRTHPHPSLIDRRPSFYADRDPGSLQPPLALARRPDPPARPCPAGLELPFHPGWPDSLGLPPLERPRLGCPPDLPPRTPLVQSTRPAWRESLRHRGRQQPGPPN